MLGVAGQYLPWAGLLSGRVECSPPKHFRQGRPNRKAPESLNSPFALFKVERAWTQIPMQELTAPDVKVQAFLPERSRREHMRPERRVEGTPHIVRAQPILAAGYIFDFCVRERHGGVTAQ